MGEEQHKTKIERDKVSYGMLWSFKRILTVGIVITAVGGFLFLDAMSHISESRGLLPLLMGANKTVEDQRSLASAIIIIGACAIATAFIYLIVKRTNERHQEIQRRTSAAQHHHPREKDKNVAKIEDLKKLLDHGAITSPEYEQKKKELLKKL